MEVCEAGYVGIHTSKDEFPPDLMIEALMSSQWGRRSRFILRGVPVSVKESAKWGRVIWCKSTDAEVLKPLRRSMSEMH